MGLLAQEGEESCGVTAEVVHGIHTDLEIDRAQIEYRDLHAPDNIVRDVRPGLYQPLKCSEYLLTVSPSGSFGPVAQIVRATTKYQRVIVGVPLWVGDRRGPLTHPKFHIRGKLVLQQPSEIDVTKAFALLVGVTVPDRYTARPDADGSFDFPTLREGLYSLMVFHKDKLLAMRVTDVDARFSERVIEMPVGDQE
jgi:hypothetical protein